MHSLPKRLSRCILDGEPFEQGKEYFSVLDDAGNRKDYCPNCWKKGDKTQTGNFWKGIIPLKKEKICHPDEHAMQIFREMTDSKQRFVLALYLQRKQQLVRRTQTLYENPETGEVFDVEKIIFSKEESESLAREITEMMHGSVTG